MCLSLTATSKLDTRSYTGGGHSPKETMTPSKESAEHVIVCQAYGCLSVHPATRAAAMALFNEHKVNVLPEVVEIANADPEKVRYISANRVADVIRETYHTKIDEPVETLRSLLYGWRPNGVTVDADTRTQVHVEAQWPSEIASWLVKHDLVLGKFSSYDVVQHNAWAALSMFHPDEPPPREIRIAYSDDYLSMADAYQSITQGRWGKKATEANIVGYIVDFVHKHLVDRSDMPILEVCRVTHA